MRINIRGFAERLDEAIKQSGKTNAQITEEIGMERKAIGKWRSGEGQPRLTYFARLCKCLNVSSDHLLGLSDKKEPR